VFIHTVYRESLFAAGSSEKDTELQLNPGKVASGQRTECPRFCEFFFHSFNGDHRLISIDWLRSSLSGPGTSTGETGGRVSDSRFKLRVGVNCLRAVRQFSLSFLSFLPIARSSACLWISFQTSNFCTEAMGI